MIKTVILDIDDNVKKQENIEAYKVKHGTVEMDGEIAYKPFRPRTFPFRE